MSLKKNSKTRKLNEMRKNPEKYVSKSNWYCYDDCVEQNGDCPFLRMKEITKTKYKKLQKESGGFFVIDDYYIKGNKCKVQYCNLMKKYLSIQDEIKCCDMNKDYDYSLHSECYCYDWFVSHIEDNPELLEKDNREAIEVLHFSDDYREVVYSYLTSIRWAKGIYSDKFCREHKIKFRFRILEEEEE